MGVDKGTDEYRDVTSLVAKRTSSRRLGRDMVRAVVVGARRIGKVEDGVWKKRRARRASDQEERGAAEVLQQGQGGQVPGIVFASMSMSPLPLPSPTISASGTHS